MGGVASDIVHIYIYILRFLYSFCHPTTEMDSNSRYGSPVVR